MVSWPRGRWSLHQDRESPAHRLRLSHDGRACLYWVAGTLSACARAGNADARTRHEHDGALRPARRIAAHATAWHRAHDSNSSCGSVAPWVADRIRPGDARSDAPPQPIVCQPLAAKTRSSIGVRTCARSGSPRPEGEGTMKLVVPYTPWSRWRFSLCTPALRPRRAFTLPRPSLNASVSQAVGITTLSLTYSRPG